MGEEKRTDMGRATRLVIDNLQGINKKLETLQTDVNALKTDSAVDKLEHKEFRALLAKHDKTLYGNGKEGLTTTVSKVKAIAYAAAGGVLTVITGLLVKHFGK
jgi:hypothetical protein